MLQVHDSAARWHSFLQETNANEISNLGALWPDQTSMVISFETLQSWDPQFAELLLHHPRSVLDQADATLKSLCRDAGHEIEPRLRIDQLPPDANLNLREIGSESVEVFIGCEVIVTKVSELKPRIYRGCFRCGVCKTINNIPQPNELELIEPMACDEEVGGCGRKRSGVNSTRFELLPERSRLIDNQWLEIQELPENVKGGAQPARMRVLAEGDLAGIHNPGDRVTVNAIPFIRSERKAGQRTPMFDVYLSMISSEQRNTPLEEIVVSDEDLDLIRELSTRSDLMELLNRSIAPSIYATDAIDLIKRSLVLQLFGGVPRVQTDGTRTRGDIHILLMGDPGVAKSQLLKFMGNISPRGRFTTGGGTTAAGLTAAAIRDAFNDGRFSLEAGALVLADMGLCAIDEFDKMSDADRGAMHEAMEQQTININKGGLSATMRTRCAILAAANPRSGRFPSGEGAAPPFSEIDLKPAMISRFDMIWLIRDDPQREVDDNIARHILKTRRSGIAEQLIDTGQAVDPRYLATEKKLDVDIHGEEIVSIEMFQKYVAYAKRNVFPDLDDEAHEQLVTFYKTSRNRPRDDSAGSREPPKMTARALEALIRLTESHARMHLRDVATIEDANMAIAMNKHWRHELMGDEFDEITIRTGITKDRRSAERVITSIVRNLCRELDGECETIQIYNASNEQGFDEHTVDRVLSTLRTRGTLFTPRIDRWRFV